MEEIINIMERKSGIGGNGVALSVIIYNLLLVAYSRVTKLIDCKHTALYYVQKIEDKLRHMASTKHARPEKSIFATILNVIAISRLHDAGPQPSTISTTASPPTAAPIPLPITYRYPSDPTPTPSLRSRKPTPSWMISSRQMTEASVRTTTRLQRSYRRISNSMWTIRVISGIMVMVSMWNFSRKRRSIPWGIRVIFGWGLFQGLL